MSQKVTVNQQGMIRVRALVNKEQVKEIARDCFGLQIAESCEVKEIDSYEDRNFVVHGRLDVRDCEDDVLYQKFDKFVLKVYNAAETCSLAWFSHINSIVAATYLESQTGFKVPFPITDLETNKHCVLYKIPLQRDADVSEKLSQDILSNNRFVTVENSSLYLQHIVRLTTFIPGQTLDAKKLDDALAYDFGKCAAHLGTILKKFPVPQGVMMREELLWNMLHLHKMMPNPYISSMKDNKRKTIATDILQKFETVVLPQLINLPKQWIHGDLNDSNHITSQDKHGQTRIAGIIDFDEMCYSYRVFEVGTALMYITCSVPRERCFDNIKQFIDGYTSLTALEPIELSVLFTIMLTRYIQSCGISEYLYYYEDPTNDYLLQTPTQGWDTLNFFINEGESKFLDIVSKR